MTSNVHALIKFNSPNIFIFGELCTSNKLIIKSGFKEKSLRDNIWKGPSMDDTAPGQGVVNSVTQA